MASVQISSPCINGGVKVLSTQDTMPFTTTKGLLNGPGQNNCFLNSAVQVLWHLDIFRRSFRDLSGHACMAESCIFCALKELFSQLQFSNETALPPDALRRALAESFFDQQRFQLGFMDDAAECFENILLRIHTHIAQGVAEDMCNVRQCIPHQKFAMTLVEQSICGACQATSEPLSFTQMVHYVSASALTTQVRQNVLNGRKPTQDSFGELLRKAGSMGDIRDCPSTCGAKIQISRTLMNRPEIVSIGIVWDSERPTLEHIMDVFATVGTTLKLGDVFHKVVDNRWAEITTHNLVGVVTYYGKHYSTFFFHTKFRVWIYFDDATVREIGARWEQVVEKCRRGRHQPLLLLYAVPNGSPVTMECVQQAASIYEKNKVDNQAIFRRSVTPSPEKPNIGSTRRAITPNPDGTLGAKAQIPINNRLYNEYQNLSIIQDNIYGRTPVGADVVDAPKNVSVHRTPSNGSSSGVESFNLPDHIPIIRRRDSGNWSGDRNSASSASSTTMENPYLYLLGKIPHHSTNGSVPSSPTRKTDFVGNGNLNGNGNVYDAGYDSYSLSSNDSSSMNTIQHLMKMGHLAKIPEDYSNLSEKPTLNCDALCNEADELLKKSRHFEDEHDLVLALALCNAAATKARAAMNAPYNNPQTLTLARMKYNTCIMRARSLHRRMTQTPINSQKEPLPEIRHTREGSSGSGKHSRQNSRDKTLSSSRQNSKELLVQPETIKSPQKSIEIYATLPKKKDSLKNKVNINFEEDSEYILYDKPARESRSIFSKSKNKDNKDKKRSRSEDRNKMSKDFSIAPEILINKDTLKREKKEEKEDKKEKDGKNKKQHKIRRKLLMGGLIKRKNRSMPDLTDTNENESKPVSSVDDSNIGIKNENLNSMCGYLSEGHLEFTGNSTNPTLERSKLMRKSFHGSAGKVLTAAKVPPPPPLRTTSQLSAITKLPGSEVENNSNNYYNYNQFSNFGYNHQRSGSHDVLIYQTRDAAMNQINTVVTQAEVHQVQSPVKSDDYYTQPHLNDNDEGVDEVDCCLPSLQNLELPPYPSPACSVIHSRQASEDFPPPPPPLDLSALEEHLPESKPSTLLSELQNKRQEMFMDERKQDVEKNVENVKSGDVWLKELQAKQAALRQKKAINNNLDAITVQKENNPNDSVVKSTVKDLASRFETKMSNNEIIEPQSPPILNNFLQRDSKGDNTIQTGVLSLKKREEIEIAPENYHHQNLVHLQQEIIHHPLQRTNSDGDDKKCKAKKKSVSFCDQVILVATAEEQEDDSYIPNPILERVLRTAMNKPEAAAIRQEILLRQSEQIKDEGVKQDGNVQNGVTHNLGNYNQGNQMNQGNHNQMSQCNLNQMSQSNLNQMNQSNHNQMNQINHNQMNQSNQSNLNIQNNQSNQNNQQAVYVSRQNSVDNLLVPSHYQHRQSPYQMLPQNQNYTIPQNNARFYQQDQQVSNYPQWNQDFARNLPTPNNSQENVQIQNQPLRNQPGNYHPIQRQNVMPYSCQTNYNPNFQHPPSPSPSNQSYSTQSSYNSQNGTKNSYYPPNQYSPVQRVPPQIDYNHFNQTISPYQRVPSREEPNNPQNSLYQRTPSNDQINQYQNHFIPSNSPYQRVPDPNYPYQPIPQNYQQKYSPYQQVLPPKQPPTMKKTVSFEPGTKGCAETSSPKAIVTPIIVNNNNNYTSAKTKCNLCRKKHVVAPNLYCADCEFYMSRFKPKS